MGRSAFSTGQSESSKFRKSGAVAVAAGAAVAMLYSSPVSFAGNVNTLTSGTDLVTPANWSLGTAPTITDDAVIGTVFPAAAATLTLNTAATGTFNGNYNSLNILNSKAITIENFTAVDTNTATLTLGGTGSTTNAAAPSGADLLYVSSASTLTLASSTTVGSLNLVAAQTGNFDIAGTATVAGALSIAAGSTLTANVAGTLTLNGAVTAAAGTTLVKTGAGLLDLGGTNSTTFAGNLTINAGTVNYSGNASAPKSTANITLGGGTFQYSNSGNQNVSSNGRFNITLTSGTTSGLAVANSSTVGNRLINQYGTGTTIISGDGNLNILGSTTASQSAVEFITANTYTGTTNVGLGQMLLLGVGGSASSSALNLAGGTFGVLSTHAAGTLVNGVNLGVGQSTIESVTTASGSVTAVNAGTGTYSLGAITRVVGATADIPALTTGVFGTTNTNSGTGNIIGGYLTTGSGSSFATVSGGVISPLVYAAGSTDYTAATASTDFDATASGTFTNSSVNSLRFNTAAPVTATATALNVASGGVLITPAVGANSSSITGGTITSGNGTDLIVSQFNAAAPLIIGSTITDNGSSVALTKAGPGTLILDSAGSNTFTGPAYIGSGTLQIGNNDTGGGATVSQAIVDNGSLAVSRTDAVTLSGLITGTGGFFKAGSGVATITNSSNSFTGPIEVNQGVLAFSNTLALNGNSSVSKLTIDDGATLRYTSSSGFVLLKPIVLVGTTAGSTGTATLDTSSTGTLSIGTTNSSGVVTGGAVTGSGSIAKIGTGTVYFGSSSNTFSGGIDVIAGTASFGSNGSFGTTVAGTTALITIENNATVFFNAAAFGSTANTTLNANRSFNLNGVNSFMNVPATYTWTIPGVVKGTGTLVKVGSGTLTLSGTNTFTGGVLVSAGTLAINSNLGLGASGTSPAGTPIVDEIADTGTLDFAFGTITYSGARNILLDGPNSTIQADLGTTALNGAVTLTGTGVLNKTGAGTLSLGVSNSYSGGSVVKVGTLTGTVAGAFGNGNLTINPTSTTNVAANINNSAALASTANVTVNNVGTVLGTLNVANDVTPTIGSLAGTGQVVIAGTASMLTVGSGLSTTFSGVISGSGSLTKVGASTLTLAGANTYTGATVVSGIGSTLNVKYASTGTSAATPLLTNAAGTDLQNGGTVVFDYTGDTSPAATIRTILAGEYSAAVGALPPTTPFLTGQIKSTTATANRGIGYIDNGTLTTGATSTVTVMATLYGDADLDGGVSINDFNLLAANFGQTGKVWNQGDFDYDGGVSINDFNLLAANFGKTLSSASDGPNVAALAMWSFAVAHNDEAGFIAATGVPEPTSLALLAGGAMLGLRRRRVMAGQSAR